MKTYIRDEKESPTSLSHSQLLLLAQELTSGLDKESQDDLIIMQLPEKYSYKF